MNRFTIDASVLIKCVVEEEGSGDAVKLVSNATDIVAPDLLYSEMANILWKKVLQRLLKREQAADLLADILSVRGLTTLPYSTIISRALTIALEIECSVYDAMYLASAEFADCPLVTDDRRLHAKASAAGHQVTLLRRPEA